MIKKITDLIKNIYMRIQIFSRKFTFTEILLNKKFKFTINIKIEIFINDSLPELD